MLFALLGGFLVLSALFSAAETALFALPRPKLRRLAAAGGARGDLFRQVLERPHRVMVGILLGNTLANVAATAVAALLLQRLLGETIGPFWTLIAQVLLVSFALLVFCEIAPKTYALEHGEGSAVRLSPLLRLLGPGLSPVAHALEGIARGAARLFGAGAGSGASPEDLQALIEEGRARGTLSDDEAELFGGAFRLHERSAADVMTPRADLVAVSDQATAADVVELVNSTGHSRIPVYEGTLERIVGIVESADLLPFVLGEMGPQTVREVMRPPLLVSPLRSVEELLLDMQRQRVQLVAVATSAGETLGIVTLEDIVEEVVGEIQSEFEEDEAAVRLLEDGSALVQGQVRVADVNRMLGTRLPSHDGDTLESLVQKLWQGAPSEGDEREAPGGDRLGIDSMVGARVWSVRVARRGAGGGS